MKITKIESRILELGPSNKRGMHGAPIVCRIFTDEGIIGDGECNMILHFSPESMLYMIKGLSTLIIGMDPLDTEVIWNKLYRHNTTSQNGGLFFYSPVSAIDIALWDIKGKYFGVPVYKLLGGKQRDKVRCYASMFNAGWGQLGPAKAPEEFAKNAVAAVDEGFTALKADFMTLDADGRAITSMELTGHATGLLDLAEARIAAVRDAVGPGIELMVEGHSNTDAAVATQFCKRLKKYDVVFYEEPCASFFPSTAELARVSPVPLAGGEKLCTRMEMYPLMESHVYKYLQPDVGRCGGITEMKKIVDLADMFELPVQLHTNCTPIGQCAALQVEAAMNRFTFHEHTILNGQPALQELAAHECIPENGFIEIPDLPGIGNAMSEYALNHYSALVTVE